jgi:hypothetical protein
MIALRRESLRVSIGSMVGRSHSKAVLTRRRTYIIVCPDRSFLNTTVNVDRETVREDEAIMWKDRAVAPPDPL